jgi:pilus assembly protein FimV
MSISSSHHDLFHQPSPAEKMSFVRSLIETGDLKADVAMALLKSIHSELAQPQGQDHSLYAGYARLMASLQHEMPDVHEHVVANWQAPQPVRVEPEEASAEEGSLETETGGEAKRTVTSDVEEAEQRKEFWEPEGEMEGSESEAAEPEEPGEIEEKAETEDSEEAKGELEATEEEEPENEEREDEEPEEEDPEEKDQDQEEEAEPEKEENETREEPVEEPEAEENEEEPQELETPEVHEEAVEESDKPEVESSGEVEETSGSEEGERMATEAAEAAAHMEHAEAEAEIVEEEPGEAEPPMEAVE